MKKTNMKETLLNGMALALAVAVFVVAVFAVTDYMKEKREEKENMISYSEYLIDTTIEEGNAFINDAFQYLASEDYEKDCEVYEETVDGFWRELGLN